MFKWLFTVSLCLCTAVWANPMRPDPIGAPVTQNETTVEQPKKPVVPRTPTLNSVVIIGDYRKAIFSRNREVVIGETINGYRVIEIEPDYVVVQRGNRQKKLLIKTPGEFEISPAKED